MASSVKPTSFLYIKLDGGDEDIVSVHDTCSIVRNKIHALLGKDNDKKENGVPAQFKKDGTPKPYTKVRFVKDIDNSSTQVLDTFSRAHKIMGGAEPPIHTVAYRFLEKKRMFEGEKKTAGRLKTEEKNPEGLKLFGPDQPRWLIAKSFRREYIKPTSSRVIGN